MSKPQFNDYVNSIPERFRLENRSVNRSHVDEMPEKGNLLEIKQYMKKFMNGEK